MMSKISKHVANSSEAISIRYNNIVYEMRQAGKEVIVLSLGEAFFEIPLFSMDGLPHPAGYHYSHSRGIIELREKIANYYEKYYGVKVDAATEILLTTGSKAAIFFSMMTLLNPEDEIIVPEPMWVSYPEQAKLCLGNAIMIPYPSKVSDFEKYITSRTRMIVINNPNNPSGYVYGHKEIKYLSDLAKSNDLYFLSDEAYSDFVVDGSFCSAGRFDNDKTNTIICNSISKNFGISGWRIGYAISNKLFINELLKINQHVITCPATNLQHYIVHYFDDLLAITYPQIKGTVQKRQQVAAYLDTLGLKYLPGNAGFYLFVSIEDSSLDSENFSNRLLEEYQVCVVPGIAYGKSCDSYIRLSVGSETIEKIQEGIVRIQKLIQVTHK